MHSIRTALLEIFYEEIGPNGPPVLLLHGWPDAPWGWTNVAHCFHAQGWRTIIPYLRGSRPTRFLSQDTPRFAASVAFAQDAIDLADALNLDRFAVIGHDWGARAAYTMAGLFPERLTALAALALAYQPRGTFRVPDFEQPRRFWYQWFQCIDGGSEAVRKDPVGFARIQWDTWSPPGWFDETEFAATSESFLGPDWVDITLKRLSGTVDVRRGDGRTLRYIATQTRRNRAPVNAYSHDSGRIGLLRCSERVGGPRQLLYRRLSATFARWSRSFSSS